MHNFKPGDLALVVGGECLVGQQVKLECWLRPGDAATVRGQEFVLSNNATASGWLIDLQDAVVVKRSGHLMPLRGDFAPERQKSQEVPA